jgi:hypothetical protein
MSGALYKVAALAALTMMTACYRTAGPVITNVRQGPDGHLLYTRCDLVVGCSLFTLGNDRLEHCVDENGKDVSSPTPEPPFAALQVADTTHDGGAPRSR